MPSGMILIVANGAWDGDQRLRDLARQASFVIATDGAWARAVAAGVAADLVIGDLDSLTKDERTALTTSTTEVRAFSPKKDETDLELALDHALSLQPSSVALYGALGRRLDHSFANLHLLEQGVDKGISIRIFSECEVAWVVAGEDDLTGTQIGDRISLLPISRSALVTTEGLRYPLHRERLYRNKTRGVSNEVVARPARIVVHEGRVLAIHASFSN